MRILIVAKTHMKHAFCVGAYDITNNKNIRLLTSKEDNQPLDTKFNIGQIWDIEYIARHNISNPHTEDVLVQKVEFVENINNIVDFLIKNVPIWKGSPEKIFDGKINFPIGGSGYLEQEKSNLTSSVGFWMSEQRGQVLQSHIFAFSFLLGIFLTKFSPQSSLHFAILNARHFVQLHTTLYESHTLLHCQE